MENAAPEAHPARFREEATVAPRPRPDLVIFGIAGVLFLVAAVAQFGLGPSMSPGFTYLAVVLTLAGIGALLAAGLEI